MYITLYYIRISLIYHLQVNKVICNYREIEEGKTVYIYIYIYLVLASSSGRVVWHIPNKCLSFTTKYRPVGIEWTSSYALKNLVILFVIL